MTVTLIFVAILFLLDILLFNYSIIVPVGLYVAVKFLILSFTGLRAVITRQGVPPEWRRWASLGMYVLLIVLVIKANGINFKDAKPGAELLINACEEYRQEQGKYPAELTDLVPKYVDKIPSPKLVTLFQNRYIYTRTEAVAGDAKAAGFTLEYYVLPPDWMEKYDSREHAWAKQDNSAKPSTNPLEILGL
ncbi:MAG: hypothetical protein HZA22_04350 [Nitrospirae bacterium]|nr:hypothetical protein [Nitrospirota bacterium]